MISAEQMKAIGEFYSAADRLRELKVIRTDRYLGDIAEFIAKECLGMQLAPSCREQGHDGKIDNERVEVKYNGGKSITITAGKPETYDELVVILGPKSVMRPVDISDEYLIYRIPSEEVAKKPPHKDGVIRLAKGNLHEDYRVQFTSA
ncbi:DUF6998 domain-containing protein [Vibrio parahaemolyticus]|uniref:DUF6998 domain-containing protein n=1 Tax=Vibrio parahaemolyticus TaxID=670 RepID=UPI00044B6500|nr:hypothetical protein [Vibrio parahaemolyticus]ETZ12392.1 hypothetical protein AJ90_25895 [Vibrio parahaemolyticus M0605]EIT7141973.1 hypothetical protein [Vibrio parahaemolyticus]ELY2121197.1 hypothetical protein [Vibrio parahaemolyticus]MBD6964587.1 hypothetical protein [Vibrio parahaemolyticus]TOI04880.1 hypothetical protein CGI68_24505 [Vibrio parahaemolyticus]